MIRSHTLSFPLIPFILLLICTMCAVNLYLGFNRNKKALFGRVVNAFNIYIFVNAFFVWIIECFFVGEGWINRMFPFIFLYGPFFYFFFRVTRGRNLSMGRVFLHSFPFLVFFITFVIYAYNGWYSDDLKYEYYLKYKMNLSWISLVGYCLYGFFNNVNLVGKLIDKRSIILFWILLLFLTIFYVAVSASGKPLFQNGYSVYLFRLTIYSIQLLVVILFFGYQTMPLLNQPSEHELVMHLDTQANLKPIPKYEKSFLSEHQLDAYETILNAVMNYKKLFLSQELSLAELALETKIPAHHLTQLMNTRLNKTFHHYINHLRVQYACELMNTPSIREMPLEELGTLSGFNSKVSFNRHFKYFTKCTPSEYRKGLVL